MDNWIIVTNLVLLMITTSQCNTTVNDVSSIALTSDMSTIPPPTTTNSSGIVVTEDRPVIGSSSSLPLTPGDWDMHATSALHGVNITNHTQSMLISSSSSSTSLSNPQSSDYTTKLTNLDNGISPTQTIMPATPIPVPSSDDFRIDSSDFTTQSKSNSVFDSSSASSIMIESSMNDHTSMNNHGMSSITNSATPLLEITSQSVLLDSSDLQSTNMLHTSVSTNMMNLPAAVKTDMQEISSDLGDGSRVYLLTDVIYSSPIMKTDSLITESLRTLLHGSSSVETMHSSSVGGAINPSTVFPDYLNTASLNSSVVTHTTVGDIEADNRTVPPSTNATENDGALRVTPQETPTAEVTTDQYETVTLTNATTVSDLVTGFIPTASNDTTTITPAITSPSSSIEANHTDLSTNITAPYTTSIYDTTQDTNRNINESTTSMQNSTSVPAVTTDSVVPLTHTTTDTSTTQTSNSTVTYTNSITSANEATTEKPIYQTENSSMLQDTTSAYFFSNISDATTIASHINNETSEAVSTNQTKTTTESPTISPNDNFTTEAITMKNVSKQTNSSTSFPMTSDSIDLTDATTTQTASNEHTTIDTPTALPIDQSNSSYSSSTIVDDTSIKVNLTSSEAPFTNGPTTEAVTFTSTNESAIENVTMTTTPDSGAENVTMEPTIVSSTENVTMETTLDSTTEPLTMTTTNEPMTENITIEATNDSITEPVTRETSMPSSTESTIVQTTFVSMTENVTLESTVDCATENMTTETTTESTTEPLTAETENITMETTTESTTMPLTVETTDDSTTENASMGSTIGSTAQPITAQTTLDSTTEKNTMETTNEPTTEPVTVITTINSTQENITMETTEPITVQTTVDSTTQTIPIKTTVDSTSETMTVATTDASMTENITMETSSEPTTTDGPTSEGVSVPVTTVSMLTDAQTTDLVTTAVAEKTSIAITTEIASNVTNVTLTTIETTEVPTTVDPNFEPLLNQSDAFEDFWVKTVVNVPVGEWNEIETRTWRQKLEGRLARIYDEALMGDDIIGRSNWNSYSSRRKKRYVTEGLATVQAINFTRPNNNETTDLVYFMVEDFQDGDYNITPAARAVFLMSQFSDQEVALRLGYVVVSKAEVYNPPPVPAEPMYWIIGAVLGGLLFLILLGWAIAFIYLKCCRTPTQKGAGRSSKVSDTADFTNPADPKKPPQGFDYVRTELGMGDEGQYHQNPEYYRRNPMGSSEKEGMYSSTETPPPHYRQPPIPPQGRGAPPRGRGYPGPRGRGRGYPPPPASRGRGYPPPPARQAPQLGQYTYPPSHAYHQKGPIVADEEPVYAKVHKQQAKPSSSSGTSDSSSSSSDSESSVESSHQSSRHNLIQSEQRPKSAKPKQPKNRREHSKSATQAGTFENVAKLSAVDGSEAPPVKIRTTVHSITLPPLVQQPLTAAGGLDSDHEADKVKESLRQKADIERWRNKQRQRDQKKGGKKKRRPDDKQKKTRRPAETADIPEVFIEKPRKKHKPRTKSGVHDVRDAEADEMEMKDMFGPTHPHAKYRKHTSPHALGDMESDSDDENLEQARQRMHDLLDEAFSLVASSRESHDDQLLSPQRSTDAVSQHKDAKHVPIPNTSLPRNPHQVQAWSPYTAADEATKIVSTPIPNRQETKRKSVDDLSPTASNKLTSSNGISNGHIPIGSSSIPQTYLGAGSPSSTNHNQDTYTSIAMDSRMLNGNSSEPYNPSSLPYKNTNPFSEANTTDSQDDTSKLFSKRNQVSNNDSSSLQRKDVKHLPKSEASKFNATYNEDLDEEDIIKQSMKPGSSSQPLVDSIRKELQQLAHVTNNVSEV